MIIMTNAVRKIAKNAFRKHAYSFTLHFLTPV